MTVMTGKNGRPTAGLSNARPITRRESELTKLPRWVEIAVDRKTGEVVFPNANLTSEKFALKASKTLTKFWA